MFFSKYSNGGYGDYSDYSYNSDYSKHCCGGYGIWEPRDCLAWSLTTADVNIKIEKK